jgi:hypothetical protein
VSSPTDQEFPEAVRELSERCVEAARRAGGLVLDYSEVSLAMLDHYVAGVPADKPEVADLVAPMVGAYFGEVARRRLGGRWLTPGLDAASWRIEVETCPIRFSPVAMAFEAIAQGEVEGQDAHVAVGEYEGLVADRLAEAPPLPEDEFYSLTGRLETLEQIADFVHEIIRQERVEDEEEPEVDEAEATASASTDEEQEQPTGPLPWPTPRK